MYRERNRIERIISLLKINGIIAMRYDELTGFFLGALHIAAGWLAGNFQSIRANTCSRFAKNCRHPPLAPW
jgi:hypothetical protein